MGNGHNRWFDKSIQLMIFEDGVAAVNCERSWADAPVAAHLFGFMHDFENVERANLKPKPKVNEVSMQMPLCTAWCTCTCVRI